MPSLVSSVLQRAGWAECSEAVGAGSGGADGWVSLPLNPPYAGRSDRPSVLQLVCQTWAFAHIGARLVLLKIALVVGGRLQDHLLRNLLLAQAPRRDLDAQTADHKTVEFPGGKHPVGLDHINRLLAPVDPDPPGLAAGLFQSPDGGGRHGIVGGEHAV